MPNQENLIPCKPGECRNPNGRPKGSKNRITAYRTIMDTKAKSWKIPIIKDLMKKLDAPAHITIRDLIALKNTMLGLSPTKLGLKASAHVEDAEGGKVTQNTVITGADGTPLALSVEMKQEMKQQTEGLSVDALKAIQEEIQKDKKKKEEEASKAAQGVNMVTAAEVILHDR